MRHALLAAAVLSLAVAPAIAAQESSEIFAAGTRVRMEIDGVGRPVTGVISSADAGALRVRPETEPEVVAVRVSAIRSFARFEEMDRVRSARRWGTVGVVAGLSAGLVAGPLVAAGLDLELGRALAFTSLGGSVAGASTGLTLGALLARGGWRPYRLAAPSVSLVGGEPAVSLTIPTR